MSRALAELLGVPEPTFRLSIDQLERASGHPSVDIRLSTDILQQTQTKLKELGLDPLDTTAPELYNVLLGRLLGDNDRFQHALKKMNGKDDSTQAIADMLKKLDIPKKCFAIRHSVMKRLLKQQPPKATLHRLGYRSLDSILKREPVTVLLAIANLIETPAWKKRFIEQYKSLQPSDFETRDIEIFFPTRTKMWEKIITEFRRGQRSTIIVSKEGGGLIILPPPAHLVASVITTTILSMQTINDIRMHSAFCKMQLVKPHFGSIIASALQGDVRTLALIGGQPLPWHIIQRFYSRFPHTYPLEVFEPHLQPEDLQLINPEEVLSSIEPTLEFWQGTDLLAHNSNRQVVSLNITDGAISCCNRLPFNKRFVQYFRDTIWNEVLLRYLQQKSFEQQVLQQLDAQLIEDNIDPEISLSMAMA